MANIFGESDALLTVSDRHETDVYPPRENCIAPATALIVWTTNTKNKCAREGCEVAVGRDGRYDRSAFAHGLPHHLNHASSPLPSRVQSLFELTNSKPTFPSLPSPPSGPQSGTESTGRSPGPPGGA